jgi:hypothetical protein
LCQKNRTDALYVLRYYYLCTPKKHINTSIVVPLVSESQEGPGIYTHTTTVSHILKGVAWDGGKGKWSLLVDMIV